MSSHAILSLRALKHGAEWETLRASLRDRFGAEFLPIEEAAGQAIEHLSELPEGHVQRNATALELIRDAHRIGLTKRHLERLGQVAAPGRPEVLLEAADRLGWAGGRRAFEDGDADHVPRGEHDRGSSAQRSANTRFAEYAVSQDLIAHESMLDEPVCAGELVQGGHATKIYGRFEMVAKIEEMRYPTDPQNWPACSWFFIAMTLQGSKASLAMPDNVNGKAYRATFEELVGIDGFLTVRTSLATRYFVGADSVGMEFDLAPGLHGDGKIDVDHGYLLAEKHPTDQTKVVVTSEKTLSFVGLDDVPFTFLCEFGWIDMMRAMAQCRAPAGGSP